MKTILLAAALFCATAAPSWAAAGPAHYTRAQVHALVKTAKTPAEYAILRDYFNQIAEIKRAKAVDEKQEWERRAANPGIYERKFPYAVDSAHSLYDVYQQDANAATAKSQHYAQLAQSASVQQ